jgi:hypothetical protein
MTRRPLLVALTGAVLRELLPLLRRIADAMDPCDCPPAWGPRDLTTLTVPQAWVEIEAES